ncbi:MAG: PAS domain S-box protein [Ignavibacteriales bacterium]|nr:PAS domain S-box protein [Ignavibacteriales bacterium]
MNFSLSFRTRLNIVLTIVIGAICAFVYFYIPGKMEEQSMSIMRSKARAMVEISATTAAPAVYFNDADALAEVVRMAQNNTDLRFLIITDHTSQLVAGHNVELALTSNYRLATANGLRSTDQRTYMILTPILMNGKSVGTMYVGISLDQILAEIRQSRQVLFFVCVVVMFIGIVLVHIVSYFVTRPINSMASVFRHIAEGDYTKRVAMTAIRETDHLAESFNRMADSVQKAQAELHLANKSLEYRVAERTRDLQREIQQHKITEIALRESEERYRTLIDLSPDGIAVHNEEKFLFVNSSMTTMLRSHGSAELLQSSILDFLPGGRKVEFREHLIRLLYGTEQTLITEETLLLPDGSHIVSEIAATKLTYQGNPSIQIVIRDITQRIRNEERRVMLEKQMVQVQKMESIGTLASGIAHDFSNILSIIVTGVNKLAFLKEVNMESIADISGHITRAANRGSALVKQLLTFAKKSEIKFETLSVNPIILEIAKVLQQTFPQDISFDFRLAANIKAIKADSNQIHQVMLNLCLNARDAMPNGGRLVIATENIPTSSINHVGIKVRESECVCVKVTDTGIGMSEEMKKRIFEPFFTTKEQGKGSGLGLAMVYGIVESHRGFIDVVTKEGEGTMFCLYFPALNEQYVLQK